MEHGITEMVNRLDLVAWQLKLQCPGLEVGKAIIMGFFFFFFFCLVTFTSVIATETRACAEQV